MIRVLGMAFNVLFGPMRDQRGDVATYLAAAINPLVAFCGLAVDTSRGYLMKSRLSYALDSAAFAGGRVMYDPMLGDETINRFFQANFGANYIGSSGQRSTSRLTTSKTRSPLARWRTWGPAS